MFKTTGGADLQELYTQCRPMNDLPGKFPFTRGVQKDMYRGKLWTMRQYAGFSTAEESNKRYHYLLNQGTSGLSVAFDLPTQIGYDSDHPLAEGEVGKVGVAIDSLADMEQLFNGINLENISTSMTINATASIILAMYIALAKKQGGDISKLNGTIQNDILKEYAARGTYIFPPQPSMRIITDIFEYCTQHIPKWNTISISGYHIREAGSTAPQELAFTICNGLAYVRAAVARGLDINVFSRRLSFFFNSHNDFFEEIAKFRAARRIWAESIRKEGATDDKACMLRFHTQTGGSTLTAQQPLNNIARVTLQALSAVLGGTQSLHTNGYDEALSLPTEEAAQIALRTQQIIAYESGVIGTVDPLGGGFFIESLTDQIEAQARDYMNHIENLGGAIKAIELGYIQKEIADAAYQYQIKLETMEKTVVGVNRFKVEESQKMKAFKIDDSIREKQVQKLKQLKNDRNTEQVKKTLQELSVAALNSTNVMPFIINAVESYATLGEISDVLREKFGVYTGV